MTKSICFDCSKRHRCDMAELGEHPFAISHCYGYEKGNPSNADRIRAMTDEELAELMEDKGDCPPIECPHDGEGAKVTRLDCKSCWLNWLKQEVADDP